MFSALFSSSSTTPDPTPRPNPTTQSANGATHDPYASSERPSPGAQSSSERRTLNVVHPDDADPPHDSDSQERWPDVSEVTLVEVALLGDLVRILNEVRAHQIALVEQARIANVQRAALVDVQREAARHQATQAEQQRMQTACAIRSELRSYNNVANAWKPLPLLNGKPFPEDVTFPSDMWSLKYMPDEDLRRLANEYEIGDTDGKVNTLRDNLALFLAGKRMI